MTVVFEIATPNGLSCASASMWIGESEVILARDSHFRVVGIKEMKSPNSAFYELHVALVETDKDGNVVTHDELIPHAVTDYAKRLKTYDSWRSTILAT